MLGIFRLSPGRGLVLIGGVAASGCSLIGLDDLAGGTGGGATVAASSVDAASTAAASTAAASTATATTIATGGGGGEGGAGGAGGDGGHGGEVEVCTGCLDEDGTCQSGDTVATCGVDAGACETCEVSSVCDVVSCVDGGCVTETVAADTPCDAGGGLGSGACDADGECVAVAENCGNGIDDDANTFVDCADPACGAFMCFPEAPLPWLGPFHIYQGDSLSCPEAAGEQGLVSLGTGFTTNAIDCPTCSCQPECVAVIDFAIGPTAACGNPTLEQEVQPDECTVVGAQGTDLRYVFQARAEGTCDTASVGGIDLPEVTFTDRLTSCAPTIAGGGCADDLACVPRPPDVAGVEAHTCIVREGDRDCPPEFPQKHRAGEGISDERTCSECGCEDVVCGGRVTMSNTPDCRCPTCRAIGFDDDTCSEMTAKDLSAIYEPDSSCKPTGGDPQGDVEYEDDYTICCVQ